MKIKCDFCKTEYTLDKLPTSPVKCALCGHVWTVDGVSHRGALMVFISACCALLAAIVFVIAVIVGNRIDDVSKQPLITEISEIKTVVDKNGMPHFAVHGVVINQTTQIYGVPDLVIVSLDKSGKIIARQKFMPSATFVEPGASVEFNHVLSTPTDGVKKITAELQMGDM